ncbi:MAG: DUF488 family protein [Candidatus Dormibacter sp.]
MVTILLQRAYDSSRTRGKRVLVDRLSPRGLSKLSLHLDLWLRDIGPSDQLRKWFGHDPKRWSAFRRRYRAELRKSPPQVAAVKELVQLARRGPVTLLYGARDQEHNEAVVLHKMLLDAIKAKRRSPVGSPQHERTGSPP